MSEEDWGNSSDAINKNFKTTVQLNEHNKSFYCTVAWFLGLTTLAIVGGAIGLASYGIELPSALIAIGGVAVGALGNLFSK